MSNIQLTPFINFGGRAREAMEHYQKVLGGTLDLQTMNGQGAARPAGPGDRITSGRLDADGVVIVGTDGHPSYPASVGENVALSVAGGNREQLTRIFNGLSEGGQVKMPLTKQADGAQVGWLADRFGINWTITIQG
jgi:PhnB protein